MSSATRVLSFVSMKGGVSKSTNAANIATVLAQQGKSVLAVDLDPRAGLSISLGVDRDDMPEPEVWLHDLLLKKRFDEGERGMVLSPQPGCEERLWVMPSPGGDLEDAEDRLTSANDGSFRLLRLLSGLHHDWDWVILDTPPNLKVLTFSAMLASTDVVICAEPTVMSYQQIPEVPEQLEAAAEIAVSLRQGVRPQLRGVVMSRAFQKRNITDQVTDWITEQLGLPVCPAMISHRQVVADSPAYGMPIVAWKPDSLPAQQYREMTDWIASEPSHGQPSTPNLVAA